MSQAPARPRPRARHFSLHPEGQGGHPLIIAAAGYTLFAGVVSMLIGLLSLAHVLGTILGVTAFVIGLVAQMLSAHRYERMVIVVGIVAAFVGMGLGFAHGGFA
ncbi:MAG: hypothetical protein ACTHJW_09605 [Streptosporangiaceae bacterium]